jgi:hypothetical protein
VLASIWADTKGLIRKVALLKGDFARLAESDDDKSPGTMYSFPLC